MDLQYYDYFLPKENLALKPAEPRDSSKLFIFDTNTNNIKFDKFYNIDKYLPKDSFLVLNNTKVLPARVEMRKETGGKVIVLFLISESTIKQEVRVMVDRKVNIGEKLSFDEKNFMLVQSQKEHFFTLKYDFSKEKLFQLLEEFGTMPIPLYLKKSSLKREELLEKYQTIFAKKEGSSAAPTASLHFTQRVLKNLERKGIEKYFVTLHVGLGTFAPITDENLKSKKLHEEFFEIPKNTLQLIKVNKAKKKKLVAVGTTVVRTLESLVGDEARIGNVKRQTINDTGILTENRLTNLFIFPPYDFKLVDHLITNFHLPKSSLMMLVEAFLQFKGAKIRLTELYNIAIKNNFRFYSFGDCMLII